ncbi:MAG: hypothetical protein C0501_15725 [Isosphaera sp.]|nr:hypothetical protein [Isosphaera sp.]
MTRILADDELEKQLGAATGPVEVVNAAGAVLGVFTPVRFPHSPYSREEIERIREEARKHPERGRKLSEFWPEFLKSQEGRA